MFKKILQCVLITLSSTSLSNKTTFYDIGNKNIRTINSVASGGALVFITVASDPRTIQYERTVYSLLDLFGYLGGLYDFMLFIGFWFVDSFQEKIFYNLLMSDLYQVKPPQEKENNFNRLDISVQEESKSNHPISTINNTPSSSLQYSSQNRIQPNVWNHTEQVSRIDSLHNIYQTSKITENLKAELKNRRSYSFKMHNIWWPIFK